MALVYHDLGKAVTEAWNEMIKEVPSSFFVEQTKEAMGIASSSIEAHIRYYQDGIYYGTGSDNPLNPNERLGRLSVFLFAIGFPGKDGRYQKVLEGLEEIAAKRGHIFTFPPPEDKRISLEHIKAEYDEENGSTLRNNGKKDVPGTKESENSVKASAHDTITFLLAIPNGNNHIMRGHDLVLTHEGYLQKVVSTPEFSNYLMYTLTISISDSDGQHYMDYTASYLAGGPNKKGGRYAVFMGLKRFLEEAKGRKVKIVHRHWRGGGQPAIRMIAVDNSDTVYLRDGVGEVLRPYELKGGKYMRV